MCLFFIFLFLFWHAIAASGGIMWSHMLFQCDPNMQILFSACNIAFTFSTVTTAVSSANKVVRDVSMGVFVAFTQYVSFFYHIYERLINATNIPWAITFAWLAGCLSIGIAFTAKTSFWPEKYLLKRC